MMLYKWGTEQKSNKQIIKEWNRKCREEDLNYRQIEEERRLVDEARSQVDDKLRQLRIIAELSAILGGFATAMLSNPNYPPFEEMNSSIVAAHGAFSMTGVALLYISVITCTFLMVGILKYDCHSREIPFQDFWRKRCEDDWKRAFRAFTLGVPMVLTSFALLAWLLLRVYFLTCVIISASCFIIQVFYILHIHSKWAAYLTSSSADISRNNALI